jgi:sugar phosphate isomerase/epimerase
MKEPRLAEPLTDTKRLSLNQITTERYNLVDVVEACARRQIPSVAIWRHKIAETGLRESRRHVRDAGLHVSSVCRGGMFPAPTEVERQARLDDNRRAIDEAAELGADVLVLVCGPAPDRDIEGARSMVADGISKLVTYAQDRGVRLGIEPLHPMFAGDRSVIVTLAEATDLAMKFDSAVVGVVVDVYHVWWDPQLYTEIDRAKGRIFGFHVSDWPVPLPDTLMGRGMMGDGVIELRRIRSAVDRAGFSGPIEVEIFNHDIWKMDVDSVLELMRQRYLQFV